MLSTTIQKVYAHDGLYVYLVLYCAGYIFFNGTFTLGSNLCVATLLTKPKVSIQSIWRIAQHSEKSLFCLLLRFPRNQCTLYQLALEEASYRLSELSRSTHDRLASGIHRQIVRIFLNAHWLISLLQSFAMVRCAALEMASTQSNSEIGCVCWRTVRHCPNRKNVCPSKAAGGKKCSYKEMTVQLSKPICPPTLSDRCGLMLNGKSGLTDIGLCGTTFQRCCWTSVA
jgi:hypothetical protein